MNNGLKLEKYSFGVGDRFAHQAKAQLRACMQVAARGVEVVPVWNKSYREHAIVGSKPPSVRAAAEAAVRELDWTRPFHVDADHIRLDTVDPFIETSDFYTLDVADAIGQPAETSAVKAFVDRHSDLVGTLEISGVGEVVSTTRGDIEKIAGKYLKAVREAGELYRHIATARSTGNFITEVSMDETDSPQTPPELLVILAAIADEKIPAQTIAPKFTGRFNKGVDYVGDVGQFEKEFNEDLAVIAHAVSKYELPDNLKLSVHSGSDKFSIYGSIRRALARTGAGIHVKTAGTNWLEEVIGLAESGGEGLKMAIEIYVEALDHIEELCAPYATVIDIDSAKLPSRERVRAWTSEQFVSALRHDQTCKDYNPSLRQLIHVGYKVAAKMGQRYLGMLEVCEATVAKNVTENLFERHLKPLFLG
ncbi:MAG TPA: tagaturonate epimerase family protein [Pyrinomonadaceae bacterium]